MIPHAIAVWKIVTALAIGAFGIGLIGLVAWGDSILGGSAVAVMLAALIMILTAVLFVAASAAKWLEAEAVQAQELFRSAAEEGKASAERVRRLSLAVDQGPASAIITDPSGTIEYVNARFSEITGYTEAEALGRKPSMLKSGRTPPEVYADLWATIRDGGTWEGEILNRRKNGTVYWDAVRISPIRDAEGRVTHFLGLQEDITERRAMVEALKERDEQFRQVTESIQEVYFLADADMGHVHYVSPAYEHVWGSSLESLYADSRSFLGQVLPEDLPGVVDHVDQVRTEGVPKAFEYRIRRPDGRIRWILAETGPVFDDSGEVYRLAGVALDITERREAEEGLRANERRLRKLFETVQLIVLALDRTGKVEYVNPYLLELTGYTADEVVKSDWLERFIPDESRARMRQVFQELVEHERHSHYTNTIVTRAGDTRMIAWHNTVLRDASDQATGTLSIGEDVTEKARLEVELRQAQKMEAVGRLAGGVAHDFNNLLTAILGPAELRLEELNPQDPVAADLLEIRAAAQRAADLTRQLLAFSRMQPLEPRIVDLKVLITDLARLLRRVIGEDVVLDVATQGETGSVLADPGQMEQLVMNLAVNARDAMPEGGRLTIETATVTLDDTFAEGPDRVQGGEYVLLAVSDTGHGMDEGTRQRIFEPFFTTKGKGKGTGLGLATVYGIVRQSGGHIRVYSEPGQGTTFKVYLPRVFEPGVTHARQPQPARSTQGTETVLVVEDSDAVRKLTRRALESRGYTVLEAARGDEALEAARRHEGPIELLVTDVVMPEMSGRELAEELVALRPEIRVIYVSGYPDETIVTHGVLAPGVNYLQKPFTLDGLARKVREVLDED